MKAKAILVSIVCIMMITTSSVSFAAQSDVYNSDGTPFASAKQMNVSSNLQKQVNATASKFLYEGAGSNLYTMNDTFSAWSTANGNPTIFVSNLAEKNRVIIKTALISGISAASTNKTTATVSTDGTNVLPENRWVTQAVMTAYETAIAVAQTLVNKADATQIEVNNAVAALTMATGTFNAAKAYGTYVAPVVVTDLGDAIADAYANMSSVWISTSGDGISSTRKWVTESVHQDYYDAIILAKNVYDNVASTPVEVDNAVESIAIASEIFNNSKADGYELAIYEDYFTFLPELGYIVDYNVEGGLDVVIPSTLGGVSVTYIEATAFKSKGLTSVVIPNSVTFIGSEAFSDNTLTSIIIPDSVTCIYGSAFENNSLTNVIIGNNVEEIGGWAFSNNAIATLTIPDSVTIIDPGAFGSNSISSLTMSDNVATIGAFAFSDNLLTDVTIPAFITSIEDGVFSNNLLASIYIPDDVTYIGQNAFSDNVLTSVDMPDGIDSIGDGAFFNNLITSVFIPDTVTVIGHYAFAMNRITSLTIGNSVTSIEGSAFAMNSLTEVTIPDSVISIGDWAFESNNLSTAIIGNNVASIGDNAFGFNPIENIVIPDSVISIGANAFSCNWAETLTIGNSVKSIGEDAFYGNHFTSIIIPDSVETIGAEAFYGNEFICSITIGPYVMIGDNLLIQDIGSVNNNFRDAYSLGGAGTYTGTPLGIWTKQ